MKWSPISNDQRLALSSWHRFGLAVLGLGVVSFLLYHSGVDKISVAFTRAAPFFPFILILEAAILACTMCALRSLYQEDRSRIPTSALIHAGLVGYAVMGIFPAGRAVAESTRAALLSRYSTGPKAAAAATRLQGVALLAIAVVSIPATLAMFSVVGHGFSSLLIAGNIGVTAILGTGILLAGRSSKVGTFIGSKVPYFKKFGNDFDQSFADKAAVPFGAFSWECMGRVLQVLQNAVLVVAVGGRWGLIPALCSEALHLGGAAAGDLIPAQLGATELNYQASAQALGVLPADALSVALLAHMAQLFWVMVGLVIPAFWPAQVTARQ